MRKTKILCICLLVLLCLYSCEKREPANRPAPDEIMAKIKTGGTETRELKIEDITEDKKTDLSKIEKYSIIQENQGAEIGVFKLYDDANTNYVKEMAQKRISKMQESDEHREIFNDAEIRSYGNYVYYVSHPEKDRIFKIIEDTLRGV